MHDSACIYLKKKKRKTSPREGTISEVHDSLR
jgi:hypothetical protein